MNKAKLKTYAPQARKDFIAAVVARANLLGIAESAGGLDIASSEKKGDVALIAGQAWPAKVHEQRERLIKRIRKTGFAETMEAIAYTWFNRVAALRYMEIHDYLGHGHRVLSSREGGLPEVIAHAGDLCAVLPGLTFERVAEMKLAGNKDGELYRLLLVAQCNALANVMPFLFERIDDESELLLPGNLERTDSVVAKLVEAIPEEDWSEVEIIGWLYQFYISEKKDQVIGKVVKSEDIPAATQLFTPNWIVQYLVQNSIGRLWMMANPTSTLKSQWPYYIEPAEQTPEVGAALAAITQARTAEDGGSLNPETITVLDPACGSGHILVVTYDVLKAIYLERGYQARAIPRLILEKNLYGLDIDNRAAQLAGFALMMKARADDRRLLDSPLKLNVLALQDSTGMDLDEFAGHLKPHGVNRTVLGSLLDTFTHAKTFGSLIQIPKVLEDGLTGQEDGIARAIESGDVFAKAVAQDLVPLIQQANILAMKFDAVVANPPYMGLRYLTASLKNYLKVNYEGFDKDLFSAFILRSSTLARRGGEVAIMSSNVWMFLSTYEEMRGWLLRANSLNSLVQLSNSGFDGATVFICAFTFTNQSIGNHVSSFVRLVSFSRPAEQGPRTLEALSNRNCGWFYEAKPEDFKKIAGGPISYWVSKALRNTFENGEPFEMLGTPRQGLGTGNNARFVRHWSEISFSGIYFDAKNKLDAVSSGCKWFPYTKGGGFRKWFGNELDVLNWENDGAEIKAALKGMNPNIPRSEEHYFKPGITWGLITSAEFSARYSKNGSIFDVGGSKAMPSAENMYPMLGLLNSKISAALLKTLNPTLNFQVGDIKRIPVILPKQIDHLEEIVSAATNLAKMDWDSFETSWGFKKLPWVNQCALKAGWETWEVESLRRIRTMQHLEQQNNELFINAYRLQEELSPDVPEDEITLARAEREKDSQRLISYTIGCMMGRYSLDEPGLIYANAGNVGFDATRYKTFPADADGIVPITDELWFEDDATTRVREFLKAVWGAETLDENMGWLAESLGTKSNETADETIRRYLAGSFFKDHLQTYKRRPIYWLFSSGKQGAFQALVYLHRYHEGTLARMRAEYVVPLTGKMQSRIEMLEKDKDAASSTAARNKIAKQIESLKKKHVELLAYDEKLRHYADMRIQLDLDDGVKVNYGKFGDLLAEVKAVTGGMGDE